MTTTSISDLKARLSGYIDMVRQGEDVLITDRGRVVARLAPVGGAVLEDSRRDLLIRTGRIRPASAPLPEDFWDEPHPQDADGRSLAALLDDRSSGW